MALAWLMAHDLVPVFSTTSPRSMLDDCNSVKYIDAVQAVMDELEELCEEYRKEMTALAKKWKK
jgi:diketogulonate reductase-like aldo/keto reductase